MTSVALTVLHSSTQPIHRQVAEAVETGDLDQLAVALKCLHNAGHPASLKTIMKLLPGFGNTAARLPLRIHVEAVLAMRRIAKREPKMVRPHSLIATINIITSLCVVFQLDLYYYFLIRSRK